MMPSFAQLSNTAMTHAAFPAAGSADDAEAAFYTALQQGDIAQLMACWADDDDILCIHPGQARRVGAAAIRAAFESLFAHGGLHVQAERVHRIEALGAAVHSVVERISLRTPGGAARQALVIATNVYHQTPRGWRLVAHHASAGTVQEQDLARTPSAPPMLH